MPAIRSELDKMGDDLALTLNFVDRMLAEGNLEAAAGAIDDQQRALGAAVDRIGPRRPGRSRRRAAIVGLAAVLAIATGSFAALAPSGTPQDPASSLGDAAERLERVAVLAPADPAALAEVIAGVELAVSEIDEEEASDPTTRGMLRRIRRGLQDIAPQAPKSLGVRVREITDSIRDVVADAAGPDSDDTRGAVPNGPAPSAPGGE